MKIFYIVNARIPTEKVHGYQISKICEQLAALGAQVELWVPTRKNEIRKKLFEFYGIKENFSVRYIRCPDMISRGFHTQSLFFLFTLLFKKIEKEVWVITRNPEIAWLFHLKRRKTVYYAHVWPNSKTFLFRFFLKNVDAIICNSRGTEEEFKKRGFANTITIPNGVDLEDFSFKQTKKELRKKLNLPQEKKVALYTGQLYSWKGINILFEAAELLKDNRHILFVVVGGTPGDYESRLREVKERGLSNVLLTGYKEKRLIPRYLCAADILLLPNAPITTESIHYTSPIKMFEYMASGIPIVASSLPSVREVLSERNALLVPTGSAKALADGIQKIISDKALAGQISQEARRDAEGCTWESRTQAILNFLKK